MKSLTCPHCGESTNPLRLLAYTKWTGHRCRRCKKRSRFDTRVTAVAGGLAAFGGALLQSIFHFHGAAFVTGVVTLSLLLVAGMARFMALRAVEE